MSLGDKERIATAAAYYKGFLDSLGFDVSPGNGDMGGTPERVARMFVEEYSNYNPAAPPALPEGMITTFDSPGDQYIALREIPYASLCEHHLMPFSGTIGIVYHPDGKILGLSKFARIAKYISGVPCTQEAFTNRLAMAIYDNLKPHGVYVKTTGTHSCMVARGIRTGGEAITSAFRGDINDQECLELLR